LGALGCGQVQQLILDGHHAHGGKLRQPKTCFKPNMKIHPFLQVGRRCRDAQISTKRARRCFWLVLSLAPLARRHFDQGKAAALPYRNQEQLKYARRGRQTKRD
jgi:hypothetical protein